MSSTCACPSLSRDLDPIHVTRAVPIPPTTLDGRTDPWFTKASVLPVSAEARRKTDEVVTLMVSCVVWCSLVRGMVDVDVYGCLPKASLYLGFSKSQTCMTILPTSVLGF
jgi:hypothetical protein